jgi:hypothetical protein
MILRREEPGTKWTPGAKWAPVANKELLPANVLLVGLPGAEFDAGNGAVRVRLLTEFDSPVPIVEPAVLLNPQGKCDLNLTLDRGMIELVNTRQMGAAEVCIQVRGAEFELRLHARDAKVSLVLGSSWPKGVPFKKNAGPRDVPLAQLLVFIQRGEVDVHHGGRLYALEAPPGPAVIQWDSEFGLDASPTRLEELPNWILPPHRSCRESERTTTSERC